MQCDKPAIKLRNTATQQTRLTMYRPRGAALATSYLFSRLVTSLRAIRAVTYSSSKYKDTEFFFPKSASCIIIEMANTHLVPAAFPPPCTLVN